MSVCRTCLSKNDLKPIFPDKNCFSLRAKQLFKVTGVKVGLMGDVLFLIFFDKTKFNEGRKRTIINPSTFIPEPKGLWYQHGSTIYINKFSEIEPNDGLTQLICSKCTILVNGALQLREISTKSNDILRRSIKQDADQCDNKISKQEASKHDILTEISDTSGLNICEREELKIKIENNKMDCTVRIEDFESSDDSNIMNDIVLEDLESDSEEEKKICIEDYESSDSFDDNIFILKEESKSFTNWEIKEKVFLERERRKMESKELDSKFMALAVTPYDPGGPIRCTLCSKEVRNIQNFKSHAKTHFEPQNACEICGKKFVSRSHMRYHQQRLHGLKKRLACSQCTYRAVDTQQLQNHKRATHTGERPYICDVCGDSFRMRANIAQHMRKHFGVKNLQCERCPAMFRSRSELTNHQNRVHNHIYTYFCYLCTEKYKRPASVRKHLVNIHAVPRNQQLPIKCVRTHRSCDRSE